MTLESGEKWVIVAAVLGLALMVIALTCCGPVAPYEYAPAHRVRCVPVDSDYCCTYETEECGAELCFDAMTTLPPLEVYCRGAR